MLSAHASGEQSASSPQRRMRTGLAGKRGRKRRFPPKRRQVSRESTYRLFPVLAARRKRSPLASHAALPTVLSGQGGG